MLACKFVDLVSIFAYVLSEKNGTQQFFTVKKKKIVALFLLSSTTVKKTEERIKLGHLRSSYNIT